MRWGLACVLLFACGSVTKAKPDAALDAPIDVGLDAETVVVLSDPMGPTTFVETAGGVGRLSVHVHTMQPNSVTHVAFTGGALGTYTPAIATVTTDGSGDGSASSTFMAGSATGTETTSMLAGLDGVESDTLMPAPFPLQTATVDGFATPFTTDGLCAPNYLLRIKITVPAPGMVKKLGLVSLQTGSNVKLGLYTTGISTPGTLVAQTEPLAVHQGRNEADVTPVAIAAGTYWIEAIYDDLGHCILDSYSGTNTIAYISMPFANALPTTFPSSPSTYMGGHFNFFVVLQ